VEPAVLYRRVQVDEPDEREVRAMAAGAVDVSVAAAPDEVWKKVGDFAGVADFFPGIDSFRMEGDDRIIGMFGMEIRERLLAKDEENRVITYSVVEGVPIDSHTATISVEPDGEGSKVIWAYDVTPDEMAPIFGDTYKAALASLGGTFS
jgi:carbon monoxide dehydrogenase subunit G